MDAAAGTSTTSLSARAEALLAGIDDGALRSSVRGATEMAIDALGAISRVHLPQDEFEDSQTTKRSDVKYVELAPYVLAAVAAVNSLLEHIAQSFEPPVVASGLEQSDDDFDLEFDLVDGPTGSGVGLSRPATEEGATSPATQAAEAAHAYGEMLRSRVLGFADRLQYAIGEEDDWPLLAELDDGIRKLQKAVQGLLFGLLGIFSQDVRREEILPEYRSAVGDAVSLRKAIAELTFHVGRFNAALAQSSAESAVPLVVAVSDRLARFASTLDYRSLRADDKRAVIDFRQALYRLRRAKDGLPLGQLRLSVEGFSKFLESLAAINHREVLVIHDRAVLQEADETLERLRVEVMTTPEHVRPELRRLLERLDVVSGRLPEFDEARRRALEEGDQGTVRDEVERWRGRVGELLMHLGA